MQFYIDMKKVLLTAAIAVATVFAANAQWYVGGAIGIQSNSEKVGDPKFGINIAPEVGYYLSDKFDVGLDLTFGFSKSQADTKTTDFVFAPYARYSFLQFGKLEVIAKGQAYIDYTHSKTGSADGTGSTAFGLRVFPQVAYGLMDNIVLFTNLNFASFYVEGGDPGASFGIGVDANNLATLGDIQIGFVYKF